MALLIQAGERGSFKDKAVLDGLKRGAECAFLRGRDEFQRLIAKLEATSKSPPDRR
jgi:hypothetical protein